MRHRHFREGIAILDGGLATELERRGANLAGHLWSARFLLDSPDMIRDIHRDFLLAGSQYITTASYQASLPGFSQHGLSERQSIALLLKSVALAREACDQFTQIHTKEGPRFVAASIGPYGAYLADGSEFRGDYGVSESVLHDFHAPRFEILARAQPDLFACETIPSLAEASVLAKILAQLGSLGGWISFSCRNGSQTCEGDAIEECAAFLDREPGVLAVGVNCTAPRWIDELIQRIRSATAKPIIVYPNSGQQWNAATRKWEGDNDTGDFADGARRWVELGASAIGGCCQTGPHHIRAFAKMVRTGLDRTSSEVD